MSPWSAIAIALLVLPAAALSQVDPGPDGLGIYFDTAGTITRVTTAAPGEMVTAWLLLTRPAATSPIAGFEVRWDVLPSSVYAGFEVCCGALGVEPWPCAQYGFPWPVALAPAVTLATIRVRVADPQTVVSFRLAPCEPSQVPGMPSYVDVDHPADLRPLHVSSGSYDLPVAVINGEAPVAARPAAWGRIKSLYH